MNQPHLPASSKLFIRSEVLAVITFLTTVETPAKQDKYKQLKRLQAIEDQASVLKILVKELQRAHQAGVIQVISELLMELGNIQSLQKPLWDMIENPKSSDEIRDAANLILRQLGDETDPSLYLDYLEDPAGLINRETERMLEISSRNPEALIDFLDFIFSLPVGEQCNLISSLQGDDASEHLLNLYFPLLLALPPLETQEFVLEKLGESKSPKAALFLQANESWFEGDPRLQRALKKALSSLKIAGATKPEALEQASHQERISHPLVNQTEFYQCFATIPDGIGNQGIIVSRERENGDICMMSVAINDLHGIIDCFGFYELSKPDFHKLIEKFHEENTKIHTLPVYCLQKLKAAEQINHQNQFRVPYEYSCWKALLQDESLLKSEPLNLLAISKGWANESWREVSVSLYQHPDFSTWFLEEEDHPVLTQALQEVHQVCVSAVAQPIEEAAFVAEMDYIAEELTHQLLSTAWRDILKNRLADAAYLLNAQKATTFARLAATEVEKLATYENPQATPLTGFIKHYGRRCIEEDLLRLKHGTSSATQLRNNPQFEQLVEKTLAAWELPV